MPAPPPPPLMDELVEEVLLRLPPDSPASLIRAGVVCKRWCGLVSDPGFQRRLADFHGRAPPMLGFLVYSDDFPYSYSSSGARFVPTSSSGLPGAKLRGLRPCDSRHGRVLLLRTHSSYGVIFIWNPITGELLKLPDSPPTAKRLHPYHKWNAAVLCAATGACDHLDCHRRGPFIVVLVGDNMSGDKFTCIYSSETGAWSETTVTAQPADESAGSIANSIRSTLAGNELYFVLENFKSVLEYNLCTRRTSFLKLPRAGKNKIHGHEVGQIQLTTMAGDSPRLGFVRVEDSRLCLWLREDEEPAGWVLSKVIELGDFLPFDDGGWARCHYNLVASAEGVGTIFLKLQDEIFTVYLRSGRVTKVYTHQALCYANVLVPYVNFCTPAAFRAPSTFVDGPN